MSREEEALAAANSELVITKGQIWALAGQLDLPAAGVLAAFKARLPRSCQ